MATISSMTTNSTTSTTKASATTATGGKTSAASVNKGAANAILTSLGTGSGIDTDALVSSLVEAQFASKRAQLASKTEKLTAQISGAATLKNFVSDFAKAVNTLVTGGSLATQPNVSDPKVATATAITGSSMNATAATTVSVTRVATAQTVTSAKLASSTQFGTGTLTLKIGTGTFDVNGKMTDLAVGKASDGTALSFDIAITAGVNDTPAGIAAAINAKNTGVTASVITDADGGSFLSIKGASGTAQAFSLTGNGGSLDKLSVGKDATATSTMAIGTQSGNAKLSVDGVEVERSSNQIDDVVPGVKLALTGTGTMTITGTRPDGALSNAVKDFVETFNQLLTSVKEQTNAIDGPLRADTAAKQLLHNLQGFASKVLLPNAAPGTPATLAGIGVMTDKQTGQLVVDETALAKAIKTTPDAIQEMFKPTSFGATGLNAAMQSLKLSSGSSLYGLTATDKRLREAQDDLTKQTAKIEQQATAFSTRLTQQYASMNSRVSAYKQTQSFMKQQIDGWYKSS